jgi:hypothetical protein
MVTHPKEIFIESLRKYFSDDSHFHYTADEWGFPKIIDLTDVPLEAGINDNVTTRIFIGEPYRFDASYYPALLIKSNGSRFVPTSFNNDEGTVQWAAQRFVDGYGNETIIQTPSHFIKAGAWEGSINIDIEAKSPHARDELAGLISLFFSEIRRIQLQIAGVFVKGVTASSPSESDDRNGKIFKQTITCEIRSEWRREIPINSVIDIINICVDFGTLETKPYEFAPNLRISNTVELINALAES